MNNNLELYFVTDESVPTEQLLFIVNEAVKGGVSVVQLREKKSCGKSFYEKAFTLKQLLQQYNVPLIINDRVDVALAVNADGVHIGQNDLPLTVVRKIVPSSMIVGVSVSTVEQAKEAEQNGANYIGVGAVFPTNTKQDAKVLPEGMIESIVKNVNIPVVAIGGIKINNLSTIAHIGIDGIAVVSGIMHAKNPKDEASAFLNKWRDLKRKKEVGAKKL